MRVGRSFALLLAVACTVDLAAAQPAAPSALGNNTRPAPPPPPASGGAGSLSNTRPASPAPTVAPRPPGGLGNAAPGVTAPAVPAPPPAAAAPPVPDRPPSAVTAAPPAAAPPAQPSAPLTVTQNGSGLTVENLLIRTGGLSYRARRLEISGSNRSRDDVARALDPASGLNLTDRLQLLSASEIAIPELVTESSGPGGTEASTYRDVVLRDVGGGRIGSMVAASSTFGRTGGARRPSGGFGRFEMREIDVALISSLLAGVPDADTLPLRPVYRSVSIADLAISDEKGVGVRIARIAGRDVLAKPMKEGWIANAGRLAAASETPDPSPEVRTQVMGAFAEMMGSIEIGGMEAIGIEFGGPGGATGEGAGRIARIGYSGGTDRPGEFALEGFEASGKDGSFRLAEVTVGGVVLQPVIAAMRDLAGRDPETFGPSDFRRLIPGLKLFRIAGLDVDVPPADAGPNAERTKFSVGTIELLADKPVEGIPTDVRLGVRNIGFKIGAVGPDDPIRPLADLDYGRFDGSFMTGLSWNEAGQELILRELSARLQDVGSVTLRAVIRNVTRDVFNPDEAIALVALVGAAAKSIDLTIENNGLAERILARETKRQGKSPDELRREWGMMAAIGIPAMLGGSEAAKNLGQAVARFVAKPGRLSVQAQAKSPAGIGAADLAGAGDPTQLLEKVDLTATAE